ncbi:MAG: hypothetical protein PHI40_08080 [Caldisericia bacterium]|nr:hypothetical protein [Caldisericia bacterium]MDD4615341.1 hypothetical protein [Caldisericia bacterium]
MKTMRMNNELIPVSKFEIFNANNGKVVCWIFRHTYKTASRVIVAESNKSKILQDKNYMSDFDELSQNYFKHEIKSQKQDQDE